MWFFPEWSIESLKRKREYTLTLLSCQCFGSELVAWLSTCDLSFLSCRCWSSRRSAQRRRLGNGLFADDSPGWRPDRRDAPPDGLGDNCSPTPQAQKVDLRLYWWWVPLVRVSQRFHLQVERDPDRARVWPHHQASLDISCLFQAYEVSKWICFRYMLCPKLYQDYANMSTFLKPGKSTVFCLKKPSIFVRILFE